MILSQAIKEVQQIIGWRSDKVAEITAALQYAQDEREKPGLTFPWWLGKEDIALPPMTVGSQIVPLPADFIQENEFVDKNLSYNSGNPNTRTFFLKKGDYASLEAYWSGAWTSSYDNLQYEMFQGRGPGVPKDYTLRNNSIRVYPIPDQPYILQFSYWGKDAVQSVSLENAWLKNAPWVLIGDAAKKLGADIGNTDAVNNASTLGARAEANMFRSVIHREEAGRRRSMGSKL